jgi:hypothetical protein
VNLGVEHAFVYQQGAHDFVHPVDGRVEKTFNALLRRA